MKVIQDPRAMHEPSSKRALVATMGALHEGHLSLMREAKKRCEEVVVSILVNPLQFSPNEDYHNYPRNLERDLELCQSVGVDLVFCPDANVIYPKSFQTQISGGELAKQYCGRTRPVFFSGVLTVVNILFHIVKPHKAFFGQKDYQQLCLVSQMVQDFWMPIEIIAMPTIREENGLAMSSRNLYLTEAQKKEASCLFQAILAVQEAAQCGECDLRRLLDLAQEKICLEIDYIDIVDWNKELRLIMAAYVSSNPKVRLIDNGPVFFMHNPTLDSCISSEPVLG